MTQPSDTPPARDRKAEKLQAIAAVFGEAVAARLGHLPEGPTPQDAAGEDRLAWQTNRLIRHLRDRVGDGAPGPAPAPRTPPAGDTARPARPGPRRVPALAEGEDLSVEHPAVIAHMLRTETQAVRVSVLRALPGHLARDVMRRLKSA